MESPDEQSVSSYEAGMLQKLGFPREMSQSQPFLFLIGDSNSCSCMTLFVCRVNYRYFEAWFS